MFLKIAIKDSTWVNVLRYFADFPFLTWGRGIPGPISSKQDSYSTLPSGARRVKCGRSVLQGRSSLSTASNTRAHSLTDTQPEKRYVYIYTLAWLNTHL